MLKYIQMRSCLNLVSYHESLKNLNFIFKIPEIVEKEVLDAEVIFRCVALLLIVFIVVQYVVVVLYVDVVVFISVVDIVLVVVDVDIVLDFVLDLLVVVKVVEIDGDKVELDILLKVAVLDSNVVVVIGSRVSKRQITK